MHTCPLCGAATASVVETVPTRAITEVYRGFGLVFHFEEETFSYLWCSGCDLRFFDARSVADDLYYDQLQKFDWYYQDQKPEYEVAASFVRPTDSVLEIGGGKGAFFRNIACGDYAGLEFSSEAIARARQAGINMMKCTVAEYATDNSERHDVVCSFQVLEHVNDAAGFIRDAVACLKPGGLLILSVPSEDSFHRYAANDVFNMPPHHVTRWSDRALSQVAPLFGLDLVDLRHDVLDEVNIDSYCRAFSYKLVAEWFGFAPRLLDDRLRKFPLRSIHKSMAGKVKRVVGGTKIASGHSVTAVFRKR